MQQSNERDIFREWKIETPVSKLRWPHYLASRSWIVRLSLWEAPEFPYGAPVLLETAVRSRSCSCICRASSVLLPPIASSLAWPWDINKKRADESTCHPRTSPFRSAAAVWNTCTPFHAFYNREMTTSAGANEMKKLERIWEIKSVMRRSHKELNKMLIVIGSGDRRMQVWW